MPKPSNRKTILEEGLRLVHAWGFSAASIRDITLAAGAPLGSFNNHFSSKEAFGIEILDLYQERWREHLRATILDESIPALEGLARLFDVSRENLEKLEWKNGCLIGNFSLEVGERSDEFRARLVEVYGEWSAAIAACLRRAVQAGDLAPDTDCDELGAFLNEALQGAVMKSKVERGPAPIDRFRKYVFSTVLRK